MRYIRVTIPVFLALCFVMAVDRALSSSQKPADEEVSAILERLEGRLKDHPPGPAAAPKPKAEKIATPKQSEPSQTLEFKPKKIMTDIKEANRLSELANAVNKLEEDIEQLSSDVQGTKQAVMEQAKIDNFVELNAELANTEQSTIRNLSVKIDGYKVYHLEEASGLWLPSKVLPLYAGPMQPGAHNIEIEANLIMRNTDGLPVNNNTFRSTKKSFNLVVADGVYLKKWVVKLSVPEKSAGEADAVLEEAK